METSKNRFGPLFRFHTLMQVACILAAVGLVINLFYLGAKPFAAGLIPQPWDKLVHFAVYSAITALLWFGTATRWPLAILAFVVALGVFDELHQASLPGRVADAADLLIDFAAGTVTSALLYLYVQPKTDTTKSWSDATGR